METDLGPRISSYQGRNNLYTTETYNSGNARNGFMGIPEAANLVTDARDVYLQTYPSRDRQMSIERVERNLSHPRIFLTLIKHEDILVGIGIFPRLFIDGDSVLYSSRAIVPEHEREGLGPYILDLAMQYHDEELAKSHTRLRYGVLFTQNPASVVSLQRAPRADNIFPFLHKEAGDKFAGRYRIGSKEQRIMNAVYNISSMYSTGITNLTGVSKRELWEVGMNENFRPDRESSTWPIYLEMVGAVPEGLEMNREAGDVVYVTYAILPARIDNVAA